MGALLDLLVPSCCDGCGRPAPPPWCGWCDESRRRAVPAVACPHCGDRDVPEHACWAAEPPVASLVTLGPWTGGVARAVARAKLGGRREVLVAAGRRLGAAAVAGGIDPDVVVPVPSDRGRARRRGCDHTMALALGAAEVLGIRVVSPFATVRGSRDRAGATGRDEGRVSVRLRRPAAVEGRAVVVVDDVVTTGATLAAVATALDGAGAARVDSVVVGRAGRHPLRPAT